MNCVHGWFFTEVMFVHCVTTSASFVIPFIQDCAEIEQLREENQQLREVSITHVSHVYSFGNMMVLVALHSHSV